MQAAKTAPSSSVAKTRVCMSRSACGSGASTNASGGGAVATQAEPSASAATEACRWQRTLDSEGSAHAGVEEVVGDVQAFRRLEGHGSLVALLPIMDARPETGNPDA